MIFKGRANRLSIGLKTINKNVRATPPNKYVKKPPETTTPGRI